MRVGIACMQIFLCQQAGMPRAVSRTTPTTKKRTIPRHRRRRRRRPARVPRAHSLLGGSPVGSFLLCNFNNHIPQPHWIKMAGEDRKARPSSYLLPVLPPAHPPGPFSTEGTHASRYVTSSVLCAGASRACFRVSWMLGRSSRINQREDDWSFSPSLRYISRPVQSPHTDRDVQARIEMREAYASSQGLGYDRCKLCSREM